MKRAMDVLVLGAGASGIAAAVSAARAGCQTHLVDQRMGAGGTGGWSGLTTLCGLYNHEGEILNPGFPEEFARALSITPPFKMGSNWVLCYDPASFRQMSQHFLEGLPTLHCEWNSSLPHLTVKQGRITRANGHPVGAVIDCTGTAEVAVQLGLRFLESTSRTQAPSVVFSLTQVTNPLNSLSVAAAVIASLLREGLPPVSFQASPQPGSWTVKMQGLPQQVPSVVSFLKTHVDGFQNCLTNPGPYTLSHRAGRMIHGQYCLTSIDVKSGAQFPDAIARCQWPIEQWDPQGRCRIQSLNTHYEIPARSLRSAEMKNLWMGGKTISADEEAIASARVMGCCLATGSKAGQLAARDL